ncbi:MAG: hypothetical protein CM15mP129_09080 [Chloroflexota bacterium]|nr:MAG: hypothetical protein CM15mP129_09080 [Chloroflexota bacterium]
MPIYEYKCNETKCETDIYELIQGFNESTGPCPECKKNGERLISAFSVHFKGSGWYSTSNRNSGSSSTKKENKVSKDSGKKSSKKIQKRFKSKPSK